MRLTIQPNDGVTPIVKSIGSAKKSIEIMIFRFDRREVEKALANAVTRGVAVTALIAHTNKAGEDRLRRLEMRLLGAGVTVSRTADDFIRYHGKMMIIDRRELHVLAFNYTSLDIDRSRSFGISTTHRKLVSEAISLFEADVKRNPYEAKVADFVVSPSNARKQFADFIKGAKRSLEIYDVELSDPEMIKLLEARSKAGVEVRLIGGMRGRKSTFEVRKSVQRLHARTMVRDGKIAFIGSQSLRQIELDQRREVGVIIRDAKIATSIQKTFEADWKVASKMGKKTSAAVPEKAAKRVAKAVTKRLPEFRPAVEAALKELAKEGTAVDISTQDVVEDVRDAVKEAVKGAVAEAMDAAVKEHEETRR